MVQPLQSFWQQKLPRSRFRDLGVAALLAMAFSSARVAQADYIEDNSFLIEEAYNQEPNVIQHISAFQYDPSRKNWNFSFTQEWPAPGQKNQFSYTIPFSRTLQTGARLNDLALHYRRQVWGMYPQDRSKTAFEAYRFAFSPRFSLLLPTGDADRGTGRGQAGLQTNLPFSYALFQTWTTHFNLGATWTPHANGPQGRRSTLDNNYGASLVHHLAATVDLLFELSGGWTETFIATSATGETARLPYLFINPGIRWAWNCRGGLQIVPGLAYTYGVGPSDGQRLVFLYLSFEHPLHHLPEEKR